jgi:DNA-binding transcriptional ArsR family regulator
MKNKDLCKIHYVNEQNVKEVESQMPKDPAIMKLADNFKILGDFTRVKILYALSQKELCVCDLAALLNMSHSAVSHQLRVLRISNLAKARKKGKNVFYSLSDNHVRKLIEMGIEHVDE